MLFINNNDFTRWFTTFERPYLLLGKLDLILCAFWIKLFPINHGDMPRYFYDLLKYSVYFGVWKHSKKILDKNDFSITLITNQIASGGLWSVPMPTISSIRFYRRFIVWQSSWTSATGQGMLLVLHVSCFLRPVASLWTVDKFEIQLIVNFTLQCRWTK